jgi:hemerythrin-like metal-binding protein
MRKREKGGKMKEELIKWSPKFSVGINEIDSQHKGLINAFNKTYQLSLSGKYDENKKEVGKVLEILLEYVRVHFSTEENYFAKWDYPYSAEHMEKHAKLTSDVIAFKGRFDKGEDILVDLLKFITEWFEGHLKTDDHKYSVYFKEKGYIE